MKPGELYESKLIPGKIYEIINIRKYKGKFYVIHRNHPDRNVFYSEELELFKKFHNKINQ